MRPALRWSVAVALGAAIVAVVGIVVYIAAGRLIGRPAPASRTVESAASLPPVANLALPEEPPSAKKPPNASSLDGNRQVAKSAAKTPGAPSNTEASSPPAAAPEIAIGTLRPAPCPSLPGNGPSPRCAVLRVAEDWAKPKATPAVDVFVLVLPTRSSEASREPLVVLSGGPGQAGSLEVLGLASRLEAARAHRDIVFVDQRGTGRSTPSLACPAIDPAAYWFGGLTEQDIKACLDPVRSAGYKLEHFDTRQSAHDLVALRKALGIPAWSVLATSYGAVLAAELLRIDEAGVSAVVLNSPATARSGWLDSDRFNANRRIVQQLIDDCRAQTDCAAAFPDLDHVVLKLAAVFDQRPITFEHAGPSGIRRWELRWPQISQSITLFLGMGTGMTAVPALFTALSDAVRAPAQPDRLGRLVYPDGFDALFQHLSYGLNVVIGCRENRPRYDAAAARAAARPLYPIVAADSVEIDYDVACPALDLPAIDDSFYRPVTSGVSGLILTGAYDTLVAPERVNELASGLKRSTVVAFRSLGHDVLGNSACAARAVAAFLDQPNAEPKVDCAERFLPPTFQRDLHP